VSCCTVSCCSVLHCTVPYREVAMKGNDMTWHDMTGMICYGMPRYATVSCGMDCCHPIVCCEPPLRGVVCCLISLYAYSTGLAIINFN
jgi:hypothetical protein